jgi:16S rRNA (guanine(966)-N(2))-methyltransferase RsmD
LAIEHKRKAGRSGTPPAATVGLRIVGGHFRGRKLQYSGDPTVRPMKDRVRESLFNLIGPAARGKHAMDLFGGTGALGLEALSRGATAATFLERHFPTAKVLRANIAALGVEDRCDVLDADTFVWLQRYPELPTIPWLVFVSPPYEFYVTRRDDMLRLIAAVREAAPAESIVAVESDARFDFADLVEPEQWDIRRYPPAVIGLYRKP